MTHARNDTVIGGELAIGGVLLVSGIAFVAAAFTLSGVGAGTMLIIGVVLVAIGLLLPIGGQRSRIAALVVCVALAIAALFPLLAAIVFGDPRMLSPISLFGGLLFGGSSVYLAATLRKNKPNNSLQRTRESSGEISEAEQRAAERKR